MKRENLQIESNCDSLKLDVELYLPDGNPKGIVQLSHGMVEDKKYYFDFMRFLANNGYIAIINDHRGHGKSVKSKDDWGYFYEESSNYVVEDLHQVTRYVKNRFPGLKLYLLGHSMGSLIVRKYMKKYDNEIEKLIVCGSPSINKFSKAGLFAAKTVKLFKGDRYRSKILNTMALGKDHTNKWLSNDKNYVDNYNADDSCGFIFTTNGFINLTKLMIDTYSKKGWHRENLELPILFIAGEEDTVIKSIKMWHKSIDFLRDIGYKNIIYKSYPGMKHAILKEIGKETVYKDVLEFINKESNNS